MGLRDVLFGRKKLKDPARERLFAISTARITLQTELNLKPAGAAGVCFKSLSAGEFVRAENDLQQVLDAVAGEYGSRLERMAGAVRTNGARLPDSELGASEAIIPPDDLSLDEARRLFEDDGLIPDLPVAP